MINRAFAVSCLVGAALLSPMRAIADDDRTVKPTVAQIGTPSLYEEISRMDTTMFDAFNAHDAARLGTFFSADLEFYHDKDGLISYDQAMAAFKRLFEMNNGMRRDLVKGTLEVYPVGSYGAIEIGSHRFCHREGGKDDCGVFEFVHVWRKQDATWKVTRVISYGH